jgi:hypothetical protein
MTHKLHAGVFHKLTVAQAVKQSPPFYGPAMSLPRLQEPPLVTVLRQMNPVHNFPTDFVFDIQFNVILLSAFRSFKLLLPIKF